AWPGGDQEGAFRSGVGSGTLLFGEAAGLDHGGAEGTQVPPAGPPSCSARCLGFEVRDSFDPAKLGLRPTRSNRSGHLARCSFNSTTLVIWLTLRAACLRRGRRPRRGSRTRTGRCRPPASD